MVWRSELECGEYGDAKRGGVCPGRSGSLVKHKPFLLFRPLSDCSTNLLCRICEVNQVWRHRLRCCEATREEKKRASLSPLCRVRRWSKRREVSRYRQWYMVRLMSKGSQRRQISSLFKVLRIGRVEKYEIEEGFPRVPLILIQ